LKCNIIMQIYNLTNEINKVHLNFDFIKLSL